MANKQIIYTDRVVGITVQNGLVRMDLAVFAGTGKGKDDKPVQRMEVTSQIVMPLDAFANAVQAQGKLLNEVVSRGKKQAEAAKADDAKK